jgi:hypothetical protein
LNYLLLEDRSVIIGGNMAGMTARELAREFGQLRKLRPTLGRAVAHYSLSLPPDDRHPDDVEWEAIGERFLREMNFLDCPFVIFRHCENETEHPHIHILCSRITFSGDVISDQNDFRRAEAVLRRIEVEHGFRPVPEPTKQTNNKRRSTMNDKNIPTAMPDEALDTPADIAIDAFAALTGADTVSCYAGENPSEKKRRDMRRAIREPGYDQLVASLIGPHHIKHVHHHQRGAVIYTTDGGRLHDDGDKLTAYHMEHKVAAQRMVAMAIARGWTSIVFTGPEEFVREAMKEALAQGLPVRAKGELQQAILQELLDAERGATGIASSSEAMPEEPTPQPEQEVEQLGLLARLQRRRDGLATPQTNDQPRKPGL